MCTPWVIEISCSVNYYTRSKKIRSASALLSWVGDCTLSKLFPISHSSCLEVSITCIYLFLANAENAIQFGCVWWTLSTIILMMVVIMDTMIGKMLALSCILLYCLLLEHFLSCLWSSSLIRLTHLAEDKVDSKFYKHLIFIIWASVWQLLTFIRWKNNWISFSRTKSNEFTSPVIKFRTKTENWNTLSYDDSI